MILLVLSSFLGGIKLWHRERAASPLTWFLMTQWNSIDDTQRSTQNACGGFAFVFEWQRHTEYLPYTTSNNKHFSTDSRKTNKQTLPKHKLHYRPLVCLDHAHIDAYLLCNSHWLHEHAVDIYLLGFFLLSQKKKIWKISFVWASKPRGNKSEYM